MTQSDLAAHGLCIIADDLDLCLAGQPLHAQLQKLAAHWPLLLLAPKHPALRTDAPTQWLTNSASLGNRQLVQHIQQHSRYLVHAFGPVSCARIAGIRDQLHAAVAMSPGDGTASPDADLADVLIHAEPTEPPHPNTICLRDDQPLGEQLQAVYAQIVVAPLAGFQPQRWYHYRVIAKGANRVCVYAPDVAGQCLKFLTAKGQRAARDPNQQEWGAYQRWRAHCGAEFDQFFCACIGLEERPEGEALRCALARNSDGSLARPVYHFFSHPASFRQSALLAALDQFEQFVQRQRLPLFDLNAGNLLVQWSGEGAVHIVCADAKSLDSRKEIIPFSRWFDLARRRKVARRFQRLRERIRQRWPQH